MSIRNQSKITNSIKLVQQGKSCPWQNNSFNVCFNPTKQKQQWLSDDATTTTATATIELLMLLLLLTLLSLSA